jgi:hypothetical protein
LLITGCAGIKPYEARDYREEGMERGLFTGSEGAFVILFTGSEDAFGIHRKADEPDTCSKEKKAEPKSGEQQP